jgi:hypothetical protein
MVDYKNGKIYRLVCNTTGDQYIGSTAQILSQRLGGHKQSYKRFLAGKSTSQMTSHCILSNNNFEIILIEDFACESKNQLERRERHFIQTMQCVNIKNPAQTREEYIEYIQHNRERMKQYYHNNKEKNTAVTKCECGGHYQYCRKSVHFKSKRHKKWATPEI